jgi:hypothetical protein
MPKAGNSAEKAAARRVQKEFDFPYTLALRLVRGAKTTDRTWPETADFVIAEQKED